MPVTAGPKQRAILTAAWLRQHDACASEAEAFEELFPEGAAVTAANVRKAIAHELNVEWLVELCERIAPAPARSEYERVTAPARSEYERVTAAAWSEYERVRAPAWSEYERVTAAAWSEYERVRAPARSEYERVTAPARSEYERVTAPARSEYERVRAPAIAKLIRAALVTLEVGG